MVTQATYSTIYCSIFCEETWQYEVDSSQKRRAHCYLQKMKDFLKLLCLTSRFFFSCADSVFRKRKYNYLGLYHDGLAKAKLQEDEPK